MTGIVLSSVQKLDYKCFRSAVFVVEQLIEISNGYRAI